MPNSIIMPKKIGVALVGTGNIALMHTLGYKDFSDGEIRALCDLNSKRARSFQEETGLPNDIAIYDDPTECFKDDSIDLVEILTPHNSHEELVVEAANAGKHVSVQKPPAMTLSGYDRMTHTCEKAGVRFRVYENFRYHPPYVKAFELIKEGVIGDVLSVNIRMWMSVKTLGDYRGSKKRFPLHTLRWKIKKSQNYKVPTLFDDGYHKQSIVQGYLGDIKGNETPVTAVRAWCGWERIMKAVKLDSPSVIIYETKKSNKYGTWNVGTSRFIPFHSSYFACDEYLEITGQKGIIIAPGCTGDMFVGCDCGGPGKPGVYWFSKDDAKDEREGVNETVGTWKSDCSMETDWSQSFIDCTRHLCSVLASDKWFDPEDPRPVKADQGRQILAMSLGMIRSLDKDGAKVELNDIKDAP